MSIGVSGDTKIAVADGRNSVEIKDLVGSVVPVYCFNGNTIDIIWANDIRKLGNEIIYETLLDDGSSVYTTRNQEFMLRDTNYCKYDFLHKEIGLMPLYRKLTGNYIKVNLNDGNSTMEHRLFAEQKLGRALLPHPVEVVHHINRNSSDNTWENLEIMSNAKHNSLHLPDRIYRSHRVIHKHENTIEQKPRISSKGIKQAFDAMSAKDKKRMLHNSYRGKILIQANWMRKNKYPITPISWNARRLEFKEDTGHRDGYWYRTAIKYFNTQEELIEALDNNHKAIEFYKISTEDVYTLYNDVGNFAILTSDMSGIILRSN